MSKVKINTDKIARDLLPNARSACNIISSARECAGRVDFPYEDYGWWGDVYNNLSDCLDSAQRYRNWIGELNNRFSSQIQGSVDEFNGIQVETIQKPKISVK